MEIFEIFLGLVMFYLWGHAIYLVATKTRDTSGYEKFVLIGALGVSVLYVFGTF